MNYVFSIQVWNIIVIIVNITIGVDAYAVDCFVGVVDCGVNGGVIDCIVGGGVVDCVGGGIIDCGVGAGGVVDCVVGGVGVVDCVVGVVDCKILFHSTPKLEYFGLLHVHN